MDDEEQFRRAVRLDALNMAFELSRMRGHEGGLGLVLRTAEELTSYILSSQRPSLIEARPSGNA